jgi:hypothetical protein
MSLDTHVRPVWHGQAAGHDNIAMLYTERKGPGGYDDARLLCAGCPVIASGSRTDHGWWSRYVGPRTGGGLQQCAGSVARIASFASVIIE